MQTTCEFLDAIKAKHALTSDYQVGKLLQLSSESAIYNYRSGRSCFDDCVAMRAASLLDVDPAYVVACMHAERAKDDPVVAGVWADLAAKYARAEKKLQPFLKAAAAFLVAVILSFFTGGPDGTAQARSLDSAASPAVATWDPLCIMSSRLRALIRAMLDLPARWLCIFHSQVPAVA